MIDPQSQLVTAGLTCGLPMLVGMIGSALLGMLLGRTGGGNQKKTDLAILMELDAVRKKAAVAEDKLALAGSIQMQRSRIRDEEHQAEKRALEEEITTLNAQVSSFKMALVAAQRKVPAVADTSARHLDRQVKDPAHTARLAELEKEAARVPTLMKELEVLRNEKPKAVRKTAKSAGPVELPEQVYKLMSSSFGKRIEQNDLQLVEGIGPKIAEHLEKHGLKTWADVAATKPAKLKKVLEEAGDRFQMHDPATWPEQCRLMAEHRWEELRKYQRKLSNTR